MEMIRSTHWILAYPAGCKRSSSGEGQSPSAARCSRGPMVLGFSCCTDGLSSNSWSWRYTIQPTKVGIEWDINRIRQFTAIAI